MFLFILTRSCRAEQHLIDVLLKLLKIKRSVIKSRWQSEAIVHQCKFPAPVAVVHGSDLRNGHMGLINDDQKVIVKEVKKSQRRLAGFGKIKVP